MSGQVISVNVGGLRPLQRRGRTVATGIWKEPVEGPVAVRGVSLDGDVQADPDHGGHDQAVYTYALEDYDWWTEQLGRELAPGSFGENLLTGGVEVTGARIGERWRVGTTLLEVSSPRIPCWKLGAKLGDPGFVRRFGRAGRPGAYLRIVEEGEVAAGDPVEVVSRPEHAVTVGLLSHVYLDERERAPEVLDAPALPERWRRWATEQAAA